MLRDFKVLGLNAMYQRGFRNFAVPFMAIKDGRYTLGRSSKNLICVSVDQKCVLRVVGVFPCPVKWAGMLC